MEPVPSFIPPPRAPEDRAVTQSPYTIQATDPERRTISATADDLPNALEAAWRLQRHLEDTVEVVSHRDGEPFTLATLSLEWHDGDEPERPRSGDTVEVSYLAEWDDHTSSGAGAVLAQMASNPSRVVSVLLPEGSRVTVVERA